MKGPYEGRLHFIAPKRSLLAIYTELDRLKSNYPDAVEANKAEFLSTWKETSLPNRRDFLRCRFDFPEATYMAVLSILLSNPVPEPDPATSVTMALETYLPFKKSSLKTFLAETLHGRLGLYLDKSLLGKGEPEPYIAILSSSLASVREDTILNAEQSKEIIYFNTQRSNDMNPDTDPGFPTLST